MRIYNMKQRNFPKRCLGSFLFSLTQQFITIKYETNRQAIRLIVKRGGTMRKLFIIISSILIFGLYGCATTNNSEENLSAKPVITNDSKQVDDFKVSIHVEKDLNVYATITYIGDAEKKDIYHGGSIFFFNIYQQDGNFKYEGPMTQPLLTTTLIRNEPHREDFHQIEQLGLKAGLYEFEAIADFSLDSDDIVGTTIKVPVSKIQEVKSN